jgi:Na+-transporting NADH:ubiquinone oxidoreductase subunit F
MIAVVAGAAALVAIITALVLALLWFERRFLPAGPLRIAIDGAPGAFAVDPGDTLLVALGSHDVLLPSACGGAGTCGMCRVRIVEGASPALPTERVHLRRDEVDHGWRLACQQRMRRDLTIALPAHVRGASRRTCEVVSSRSVATFIRELVLAVPDGERLEFAAGSYVQVEVPRYAQLRLAELDLPELHREEWQRRGLFALSATNAEPTTRAYSLANPPAQADRLVLNVRIATPPASPPGLPAGVASSWLWSLRPGDRVAVTGPFGEFHIHDTDREMIYIGGGAGMAPLRSHLLHLFGAEPTTRQVSYWYGARSQRELFYGDELDALARVHPNFRYHVALSEPEPGEPWDGDTGFIHEVVHARYLADHPALDQVEFYLCGPPPMMTAVRRLLADLGVDPAQIAFDDFGS